MLEREGACLGCLLRGGLDESEKEPLPSNSLVFGDFEVERRDDGSFWELGRGAMGVTYRARDKILHRQVALKVIEVPAKAGGAHAMRERFLREARAAAALRHANVASVFQFGAPKETSRCYYAMELVEGETLATLVRRDGPLPVEAALEIAIQVTRALVAAAAHGLIHRDLKPANIMLAPNDTQPAALEAKVIDFGLAKATAGAANEMDLTHGAFVGTPTFASPEQFAGNAADARSDIYSLGVTLWYALTGEVPYPGKTIEEIRASQKEATLRVQQLSARKVPAPVIKLLRHTLAINPVERPASARVLLDGLEECRMAVEAAPRRRRLLRQVSFALGFCAIGALGLTTFLLLRQGAGEFTPEKSIAVLPFENRSTDQANAYLSDGIQDEILTRLSKIADLKVISRASVMQYKSGVAGNLPKIGQELGVAHILEGSVHKSGDSVRVNVQLMKAANNSHLWAETYDRKLTDIFAVESEIAQGIAESLQAKLTGQEAQALAVKPTNNPEAYDAYLRGLAFEERGHSSRWSLPLAWEATGFYERAVQLDPNFALAWARLSRVDSYLYAHSVEDPHYAARGDGAKRALENAQKLVPNSPETLLALGYYQYWALRDFGAAKATFGRVSKVLPNSSEVPYALSLVTRREGNWDESIAYFEQALALDPFNVEVVTSVSWTYTMLRQFRAALKLYDRALDITPNDPGLMAAKASIYQARGDLEQAAKFVSEIDAKAPSNPLRIKITQLTLERHVGEAVRLLQARQAQFHFASAHEKANEQVVLAFCQRLAGDTAGAKVTAEQARNTIERLYRDQPDNGLCAIALSGVYAAKEEKDLALEAAERAMTLDPFAKDPVAGPSGNENLAVIQTIFGENSRAIAALTQLLQTPYYSLHYGPAPITPALLRLDPIWDPLRADPAFQKLCEEKKP
jgi:serine/threonine protein kinase/Flp pilus assembly protein TadD